MLLNLLNNWVILFLIALSIYNICDIRRNRFILKKNLEVILSSSKSNGWSFWDYGTQEANLFDVWYSSISEEGRDLIDGILKACRDTDDHRQWLAFKRFLKGKYKPQKIWELRFKANRCEHRVLGIFSKNKSAILLMGCYHKGNNYTPTSALDIANERAKAVRSGRWVAYARTISTDL